MARPSQRINADAEKKYDSAIALYTDSALSIKQICEQCGVGVTAFSSYLSKHHRDLIIKRHNLDSFNSVRLRGEGGQTTESHYKYRDAIAACDSVDYIEYNISQIARIFGVSGSALASQLRRHYPEIIPRRQRERQLMGITTNLQYGVRKQSTETYARAIELLRTSDITIGEAASACKVSYTGLREHILAYHPQLTRQRVKQRNEALGRKIKGQRNGRWSRHSPKQSSIERYAKAVELYKTTSKDITEIARLTSVSLSGFRHHLRCWHQELIVDRRGFDAGIALSHTKRYKKSTAEKYAAAINQLQNSDQPMATIAAIYGLHPETFRAYLRKHHPELAASRGMVKTESGQIVSNRSVEKYATALQLYQTTTESLKAIATRLGLTYNSVGAFIRRNHPDAVEQHKALLSATDRATAAHDEAGK